MPEGVRFQTKPQLAQRMLERAVEAGVPFRWVTGDEVYGNYRNLRLWLEVAGIPHVLAIKSNEKLWALRDKGPQQVRADQPGDWGGRMPLDAAQCRKRGQGSPGLRLDQSGDTASEGAWKGLLAFGSPQHCPA